MESTIALAALGILAVANAVATWIAIRNPYTERRRKLFQVLAAWFIPVFGAILVFAIYCRPEKPTGSYRESLDAPWDDFAGNRYVGGAADMHADDQP
jgi:hypothetical protein